MPSEIDKRGIQATVCKHIIAYADERDARPCPVCELARWKAIALVLRKYGNFQRYERQYSGDMPLIIPKAVCLCCQQAIRGNKGHAKDCELQTSLTNLKGIRVPHEKEN